MVVCGCFELLDVFQVIHFTKDDPNMQWRGKFLHIKFFPGLLIGKILSVLVVLLIKEGLFTIEKLLKELSDL